MKRRIVLAGNPNVGKSTIFNSLTGMNQHTGNWPGKTVSNAKGNYVFENDVYEVYDLPGIYSLLAHSEEEVVARDFLCFGEYDLVVVVCDAVCLMRNLNLVLQIMEITSSVVVCVNLMDEANKKQIFVNMEKLSSLLGVPVVATSARDGKGISELLKQIQVSVCIPKVRKSTLINYPDWVEESISLVSSWLPVDVNNLRWVSLQLLRDDAVLQQSFEMNLALKVDAAKMKQLISSFPLDLDEVIVETLNNEAEEISRQVVRYQTKDYLKRDRKIDKIVTNKLFGIPIMLLLLLFVFWLTITVSNYPSSWLQSFFSFFEGKIFSFVSLCLPQWLTELLVFGIYRTLSSVVSVMLPPMLIFFPLFTLLEDFGYLPRIAFNVDKMFQKCCSCGKQALTMCMGFGCNAVGVTGCRIIDSPRERLISILTNSIVPCNGRFPTIIALLSMFIVGLEMNIANSFLTAMLLVCVILFSVMMTLTLSKLLSKTLLKGVPSSFVLELPPYRKPKVGSVIVRSVFDRTLFVLGRAIKVTIPVGIILWLMANITVQSTSILVHVSNFLHPFASIFGLDGVILLAFILGFPANEIVIPIMLMGYLATGSIEEVGALSSLRSVFITNGWTVKTAVCVIVFSLLHWPCSTTCLTIKKETNSWKWTLLAFLLPTILGFALCFLIQVLF